jgi:hypothetical protein
MVSWTLLSPLRGADGENSIVNSSFPAEVGLGATDLVVPTVGVMVAVAASVGWTVGSTTTVSLTTTVSTTGGKVEAGGADGLEGAGVALALQAASTMTTNIAVTPITICKWAVFVRAIFSSCLIIVYPSLRFDCEPWTRAVTIHGAKS